MVPYCSEYLWLLSLRDWALLSVNDVVEEGAGVHPLVPGHDDDVPVDRDPSDELSADRVAGFRLTQVAAWATADGSYQ